jgi:radical SAM superfamily enzyme YgiQ (UPF0313 family)
VEHASTFPKHHGGFGKTKIHCGGPCGDASGALLSLRGARVLGVNPPVFDFAYFDLWAKPLGLLYLLETLRRNGNDVTLLDCIAEAGEKRRSFGRRIPHRQPAPKPAPYRHIPRTYFHFGLPEERFLERLRSLPAPDVILVTSGMTYWYPGVFWCIERLRHVFPKTPLHLGGIYARLCPDHATRSGADFVQSGPFPIFAPFPALDLYENPEYGVALTSFGCPFRCDYCASSRLWPAYRRKSVDEAVAEITAQLTLPSVRAIAFYDDALLLDKERFFYPLCEELARRIPRTEERTPLVSFHTPNGLHVREIDRACAAVLRRTGFATLRLSLESTDPAILLAGSAKVAPSHYEEALQNLRLAGYDDGALETYLLLGLPGQSRESVEASIRFARGLGARVKLAEFSPIPGTPLFDAACRTVPDLATEPLLANNSVYTTYISGTLSPKELQALKDLAAGRERSGSEPVHLLSAEK